MRLVTYVTGGQTRIGALDGQAVLDLRTADELLPATMISLLAGGEPVLAQARAAMADAPRLALGDVRLIAPVPRPPKVLAVGVNYRDHAGETNAAIPKHPVVFAKMPTCITGPDAPIHKPRVSDAVDWEAELCVVIGKRGRHIAEADALQHVAGYMAGNDVTVRDWQAHSPTWMMGKGFDTHGPTGPALVTADEVDAGALDIRLWVNGELKQDSNTRHLIFGVPEIIAYLSTAFTLEPGDVIFTGTPAGVGVARRPPQFLRAGDVVRVEIEGLGVLENEIVDEP